MLPLTSQIQIMTDQAKACEPPVRPPSPTWADDEKTLADLQARVAKTVAYLKTSRRSSSKGPRRRHRVKVPDATFSFTGKDFLLSSRSRTSISTSRRRTGSCATTAWRSARATSSATSKPLVPAFPRSSASEGPLRGRRKYVPVGSLRAIPGAQRPGEAPRCRSFSASS